MLDHGYLPRDSEIATDSYHITTSRLTGHQLLTGSGHLLQTDQRAHDQALDIVRLPLARQLLPHGQPPGPRHLDGVYAEKTHPAQDERHDRGIERRGLSEAD